MLLAIHDAILFEIPEKRIEEARKTIEEIMQVGPRSFSVPLAVNIRAGKNWKECQG
jgi:DNA polymerase I-like protein with 3'-5' exonuclease and polymerase domains